MSNTQGQPLRGDAALLKAIATGSPVATNGKQEAELNTFTPGEWIAQGSRITVRGSEHLTVARVGVARDGDFSVANVNLIASAPSLHAYAKAEELRHHWHDMRGAFGSVDALPALREFEAHLQSMGWYPGNPSDPFLSNYRAAALAKAEGVSK